jgi:hypothetical protein
MKIKASYPICLTLLLILPFVKGYSQSTNTPVNNVPATTMPAITTATTTPTVATSIVPITPNPNNLIRPGDALGVPQVDTYVTNCYNVYDQTNQVSAQLNAIEQQAIINKKINMDTNGLQNQVTAFKVQLVALNIDGNALVASSSQMTATVTKSLEGHPFKIPSAIIRVKNSTKAVKISLKNIHTMLTVTIVNIEHRLQPVTVADSAKNKAGSSTGAIANTGKTMKTSISITGLGFSSFNSFFTELNTISTIKTSNKKFSSSGTSEIDVVHYGTTDDLLNAVLANCKDIVAEKNIGSSESGKISLAF